MTEEQRELIAEFLARGPEDRRKGPRREEEQRAAEAERITDAAREEHVESMTRYIERIKKLLLALVSAFPAAVAVVVTARGAWIDIARAFLP